MNAGQQAMLLDLVARVGRNRQRTTQLPRAWRRSRRTWPTPGSRGAARPRTAVPAYYRIQGPTLVIEYAPQPLGGDPDHAHPHDLPRSHQRLREEVRGALSTVTFGGWARVLCSR